MSVLNVGVGSRRSGLAWFLIAVALTANGPRQAAAQAGNSWVGRRVITRFGAVLRVGRNIVDNEKLENMARGGQRNVSRIYRVEQVNGPWLWIKDEDSGAAGWITARWLIPYDQALDYFTNEIRVNSANCDAYIRRGHIWRDKKEYDIALADYTEAIRLDPDDEVAWCSRGNVWCDKKEYDQALAAYTEAIRLDPKFASAYAGRGNAWYSKKEYDKAIADCTEAIRLDPKYVWAYIVRGAALYLEKKYGQAIADDTEAIRLDPRYPSAFANRGNVWCEKKEYDQALTDYTEAIRLDPEDTSAYAGRGNAWRGKKEYDKAIADCTEAIRLDPQYAWAYVGRGNAWSNKKEYDQALADYSEAIRLDPKFARAYNNRGYAWLGKKEYDKAIADHTEAIRLDPKYDWAYLGRSVARMLARQGDAVRGFREVIGVEDWKGGRAAYAVILGNLAARQAGDEAAAKAFLDDAAGKLDASWPEPAVRYLRGEIDEPALMALAVDDDKRTEAHCYLGLDLALKGRRDDALAHLRWVVEHGNRSYIEYGIAAAELDRLTGPGVAATPD